MATDGSEVVHGVVVASERDWNDVVDLVCLGPAPYEAALVVIALEYALSHSLPLAIVPVPTSHRVPLPSVCVLSRYR